jgi:hypothetical protein
MIDAVYLSLVVAIILFAWKRKDASLNNLFVWYGFFILLCGFTHLFLIWVLWNSGYGPEGIIKAFTAIVSALAAVVTWRCILYVLSFPSLEKWEGSDVKLQQINRQIEREVVSRAADLEQANAKLVRSENELKHVARENEQHFRMLVNGVTIMPSICSTRGAG